MSSHRSSGVLLHPTSLPGAFGSGDLGPAAFEFIEFLAAAGQGIWQVLPLGPTGYGDSPYQCFSAFAGNPLLISLEHLLDAGLLTESLIRSQDARGHGTIDYPAVIAQRQRLWPHVLDRFEAAGASSMRRRFETFCREHASWLDDFALFMAVKGAHDQKPWTSWEPDIAHRDPSAVARWSSRCERDVRLHKLLQFVFFEQWQRVRDACQARSIRIMGDLPIFVAHDSADVWGRRELFRLGADGQPTVVAGVPPDYFSETGQLWGNPHYRWDNLEQTGFAWWVDRFRALLALVDVVRIDHFRGFVASWEIPAGAPTAVHGTWVSAPGVRLFGAVQSALQIDRLPFVAENLGVITPDVEALRRQFGFPGMAILQFAFGTDPQAPDFKPHNYSRNLVAYTGTHDNDTTAGWWTAAVGHSTRTETESAGERDHACRYLALDAREAAPDVAWAFVRAVLASVAETAIIPAQDLLALGTEARMNRPGTASGNWRWRLRPAQLTADIGRTLKTMTATYERT